MRRILYKVFDSISFCWEVVSPFELDLVMFQDIDDD